MKRSRWNVWSKFMLHTSIVLQLSRCEIQMLRTVIYDSDNNIITCAFSNAVYTHWICVINGSMKATHNTKELKYCCHSESKQFSKEWKKNHRTFCCRTIYERDQQTDIQNFTADFGYNNNRNKKNNMIFIIIMNTFGALVYKYKCSMPNYMK